LLKIKNYLIINLLKLQYRCIINACIEDLNQAADSGGNENKSQEDLEMSEVFYKAELVWNLCEIIYLEKPSGILPGLLEWIQIHFPSPIVMAETVMTSSNPACHPNYWNAVFGLVFQLRLDSAIKLLKLHPDANVDSFLSACELLKKMPIFGVCCSKKLTFLRIWQVSNNFCSRSMPLFPSRSLLSAGIIGGMNASHVFKLEISSIPRSWKLLSRYFYNFKNSDNRIFFSFPFKNRFCVEERKYSVSSSFFLKHGIRE